MFILGMQYFSLGVLRRVFGARYGLAYSSLIWRGGQLYTMRGFILRPE